MADKKKKLSTVEQARAAKAAGTMSYQKANAASAKISTPAAKETTAAGAAPKAFRYDTSGKLIPESANEEKKGIFAGWTEAVKNFLTGKKEEQQPMLATPEGKNITDSLFTEEYFAKPEMQKALGASFENSTVQEKASFLDAVRRLQAGINYNSSAGGENKPFQSADGLYAANDTINQQLRKKWMTGMLQQATEEDVRWLLDDMQKKIDSDGGEFFKGYTQEDLDIVKDYARKNYSGFANEDINRIAGEMAAMNIQKKHARMGYDAELLDEANSALEWLQTGNDPITVVEGSHKLRDAVDFDELVETFGDNEMAFTDELRRRIQTVAGAETAAQDKNTNADNEYQTAYDALKQEMDEAVARRDELLTAEKYERMLGQSWVDSAAGRFDAPDYLWSEEYEVPINSSGDTETRYRYNLPTMQQIMEDPNGVGEKYQQAIGAGAAPGMSETINLVKQMTDEERQLYKAIAEVDGEEAAQAYFDHLKEELTAREAAKINAGAAQYAEERPIIGSALSVGTNILGNAALTADALAGREGSNQFTDMTETIRQTVGGNIAEATPWANIGDVNALQFLYGTGMSAADMLAMRGITGLSGGGQGFADLLLGNQAFAQAYADAYERTGGDVQKAWAEALAIGGLEAATEHISWGKLEDVGDLTTAAGKATYLAKNAATEALEEGISNAGGQGIQALIEGKDSEIARKFADYTANGYSNQEALKRIALEFGEDAALDMLGGGITGGALSGANVAIQTAGMNAEYRDIGKQIAAQGNASAVIEAGLQSQDKGTQALAKRLLDKISDKGELPDDAETRAEVQVVAEAVQEEKPSIEIKQPDNPAVQVPPSEPKPTLEIKQPDNAAVPVQQEGTRQPEEMQQMRTEAAPEAAEELPELDWKDVQEQADEAATEAAPKAEETPAKPKTEAEKTKEITEVFTGSTKKLGKLYTRVVKALDVEIENRSRQELNNAIKGRLAQLGETKLDEVTDAISAIVRGEEATQEQKDLLEADTIRSGVLNELVTGIMGNGNWASGIESERTTIARQTRAALLGATSAPIKIRTMQKSADGEKPATRQTIEQVAETDAQATLKARGAQLGSTEAADTMIKLYDGKQNARAYSNAFQAAYDYGSVGTDMATAKASQMTTGLTDAQFEAAYNAGVNAENARPVPVAARSGGKITFAGGLETRLNGLSGNQRAGINALRRIAETGIVNIEFFESEADASGNYSAENGSYDPTTNTIRIDINAGRNNVRDNTNFALLRVAGHELTHFIKAQNTEGYKALRTFVTGQLTKDGSNTFDGLVARKMELQPELSYAQAVEEVVADGCEMMLKDSTAIQQLAQENKGLFKRIRNWLKNFVSSVKRAFQGVEASSAEARMIKDLEGLQKLWDDALVQAGRNVQQNTAEKESVAVQPKQTEMTPYPAEMHIDNRDDSSIADMEPFFDAHADLRDIYAYHTAEALRMDAEGSVRGEKIFVWGEDKSQPDVLGQKRITTPILAQYMDKYKWGWDQLKSGLDKFMDAIKNEKPIPNTLMMKRLEMLIDDVLTNGYTDINGTKIAPAVQYIKDKAQIEGSANEGMQHTKGTPDGVSWDEYVFGGTMFSKRVTTNGTQYVHIDNPKALDAYGTAGDSISRKTRLYMRDRYRGIVLPVGNTKAAYVRSESVNEYTNPVATIGNDEYEFKMRAVTELENLLASSSFVRWNADDGRHKDAVRGWNTWLTRYAIKDPNTNAIRVFEGQVKIKRIARGDVFYDITKIKEITNGVMGQSIIADAQSIGATQIVAQNQPGVKMKSVRTDQTQTAEFRKWFKGSKIVNEDGSPKVMYHGTPYGGYTVFKDWQYFTDNQQYADVYQNPSASSIRGRYNAATNPSTYAVYLSVKKPFDTRDPDVHKIWQNEFYGKWGDGTPLSERGLPDWTEGIDLVEFLEENEYDFDAIILDEGGTGGYGEEVNDRGISVVVRSSNQIKSATDNIGTFDPENPDIRYSIRTDNLSDRDILADAFESVAQNDNERDFIRRYREQTQKLNEQQERLNGIRSRIREIMFTPGKRDAATTAELNRLKTEADVVAGFINKMDKKLLAFEKAKPLQDVLARERKKIEKQSTQKRQESMRKVRERRDATEIRHKIKNVLNDFNRRLKNPTEKSYIPANMVQLVIAAEEMVSTDYGREKSPKTQAKLAEIQGMYARYKSDATFAYVYDPIIDDMLTNLGNTVGNKTIYHLNNAELEAVYDTLKALQKQVTEAVKLKAGDYARNIVDAGREMARETMAAAPMAKGKAGEMLNWQLTPDKFFARLAGYKKNSIWSKVAETFSKGTEKMYEIQRDHYNHFRKWTEAAEFDKLGSRKDKDMVDIGLVNENGEAVKITRGMMLSVYMHLSSEDNARGFMYGGFSVPNMKAYYNGKVGESYGTGSVNSRGTAAVLSEIAEKLQDSSLTDEQRTELEMQYKDAIAQGEAQLDTMRRTIEGMMTEYERGLIEAVHEWNDGKSQGYINDVTMDLYGIKKAQVQNYYPIHRDTAFVNTDFASISRNVNLENWGSLKNRVPSQAPILLTDICFEMDNSMKQMSRYVGYARAQRDFGKLYNVRLPGMKGSVKKAVSVKFGTGRRVLGVSGEQYIENYIGSITGSRKTEGSLQTAIRRNLPRATMTLNLRVGFSQLSAIPKAAAEVGWGNMAKGFIDGGAKAMFSRKAREELAAENVWFWQRWHGEGGQREFADAKGGRNAIDRAYNAVADSRIGKWLFNWCQNFDVMSTVSMKSMAEAWVQKNTRHAKGSAEYNEAVKKKYTEIVRNTQAMSSVTERSDLARSTREGDFIINMYKSEAFANFNMMYDAIVRLRKYNADLKAGANGVTEADVKAARNRLVNTATSVVIGAGLGNAVLRLAINAVMHAMNEYRNDEDEVTLKSTMTEIANEVAGDVAGMVVFGGDLYEFLSSKLTGNTYYGISDSAVSEVSNALEQIGKIGELAFDKDSTLEDWKKASGNLAKSMANMMGLPVNNAKRFVTMVQNHVEDIGNGEFLSFEAGANRSNGTNYTRLVNASLTGDELKWERAWRELTNNGLEEDKIRQGYRTKLKDAYMDGDVSRDMALQLLEERGGQDADDAYWTVEEWEFTGEGNYSKYTDLRTALAEGNSSNAAAAYRELAEHGVKEETLSSEISKLYRSGEATNMVSLELRSNRLYTSNLKLKADGQVHKDDFDEFITAIVTGRGVTTELIRLKEKGYSTSQCMSAINGAFGNQSKTYRVMETYNPGEAKVLMNRILDAYEALGLDRQEEMAWIAENWDKYEPEEQAE